MSPSEGCVDLVIIGHLAYNRDLTPTRRKTSDGGSAFYTAVGATVVEPSRVGIVAAVGEDYRRAALERLGVNVEGIRQLPGRTAHFTITQRLDGTRGFDAAWGVADHTPDLPFPASYRAARRVHLATMPPEHQLAWLRRLHRRPDPPLISIDTFEYFVQCHQRHSRDVCKRADLVFTNEAEWDALHTRGFEWTAPTVLTRGARGALYLASGRRGALANAIAVPAARVWARETTGAGDVLAGAFLAWSGAGLAVAEALHEAALVATESVRGFGVRSRRLGRKLKATHDAVARPAIG